MATPSASAAGELEQRLRLGKTLGSGAYAVVHRGTYDGRAVAVKVLLPQHAPTAREDCPVKMFIREGELLRRLDHDHVVRCLAMLEIPPNFPGLVRGYTRPTWALVLEVLEGGSLASLVFKQMQTPWKFLYDNATAMEWSTHIASGLAFLHGCLPPVIHRDVKMENILLSRSPDGGKPAVAKLTDLGLHTRPVNLENTTLLRAPLSRSSRSLLAADSLSQRSAGGRVLSHLATTAPGLLGSVGSRRPGTSTGAMPSSAAAVPTAAAAAASAVPANDLHNDDDEEDESMVVPRSNTLPNLSLFYTVRNESRLAYPVDPGDGNQSPIVLSVGSENARILLAGRSFCSAIPTAAAAAGTAPTSGSEPHGGAVAGGSESILLTGACEDGCVSRRRALRPATATTLEGAPGVGVSIAPAPPTPPGSGGCGGDSGKKDVAVDVSVAITAGAAGVAQKTTNDGFLAGVRQQQHHGAEGTEVECPRILDSCGTACPVGVFPPAAMTSSDAMVSSYVVDTGSNYKSQAPTGNGMCFDGVHVLATDSGALGGGDEGEEEVGPMPGLPPIKAPAANVGLATSTPASIAVGGAHIAGRGQQYLYGGSRPSSRPGSGSTGGSLLAAVRQHQLYGSGGGRANGALLRTAVSLGAPVTQEAVAGAPTGSRPASGMAAWQDLGRPQSGSCRSVTARDLAFNPSRASRNEDTLEVVYCLTGETGSCMTMAPEIRLQQPYNEKIDVYAFGVVLYEIWARSLLAVSHVGTKRSDLPRMVLKCQEWPDLIVSGYRPGRMPCIPEPVWQLITECWDQDPLLRPTMAAVEERLRRMATEQAEEVIGLASGKGGKKLTSEVEAVDKGDKAGKAMKGETPQCGCVIC